MATTTAVLDVNETMVALDPVARRFAEVGLDGALDLFFARVLRDGFAVAAMGRFATFAEIARHHVTVLAGDDGTAAEQVVAAFREVTLHPDVEAGLLLLRDAGLRTVALTNGSTAIAEGALARGGVAELVDELHDVGEVGAWKPARAPYDWLAVHCDVAPQDCALVAVHPWDVAGAMRAGYAGAWVDRAGSAWPPFMDPPTVSGRTYDAVCRALVDRG